MLTLQQEINRLDRNNIRLHFIGDRTALSKALQAKMQAAEQQTQHNTALHLVIAVNYGGKWDITQAVQKIITKMAAGELDIQAPINHELIQQHLSISSLPEPDLFIRTGGEQRISNFLLWQLAYTEFYFTPTLWPDFNQEVLKTAIDDFKNRERRFGGLSKKEKV